MRTILRAPPYPAKITKDYLKDGRVNYETANNLEKRDNTVGVAQVSILSPFFPVFFECTIRDNAEIGAAFRSNLRSLRRYLNGTDHGTERRGGKTDIISRNETDLRIHDKI